MTTTAQPASMLLDKTQGVLQITWRDGAVCRYPLGQLREACPCVECRGGHAFMGREFDPKDILVLTPKRSYGITELNYVGNYAIQPVWDDGHHTGLYTWDFLRRICPKTDDV